MCCVFRHIIECAQSYCIEYTVLSWLFLAIPINMWLYCADGSDHDDPDLVEYPDGSPACNKKDYNVETKIVTDL